jgi:hypothetical protein
LPWVISLLGFMVAKVHLMFFDRLFLARGRVSRLMGLK